jgi:alpha-beta hydrolase superfamily lysophospholipase
MLWYVVAVVVAPPALWILGDLLHALIMRAWYARWDRTLERDAGGVRAGCREGDVGDGPTAFLLVHGFGDSAAVWVRMAPALADRGFAVRTLRLPGHGLPMAEYRRTRSELWRQAVIDALADLRSRHARVVLLGHSMGCAVALDAVAQRPDLVDGMVLLAPLIDVAATRSPLIHPRTWFRLVDPLLVFTDRIGLMFPPDLHDAAARPLMREDRFVPRVIFRELFAVLARNRGRARAMTTPLLMVVAKTDLVIDNDAARQYFAEYGGPKRLVVAELAGHMLPLDFGWEGVVDEATLFARDADAQRDLT